MERSDLIEKIETSRARLQSVISEFGPEQMAVPVLPDGWTVKDLLAHLGWWEFRTVDIYGTLANGATPRVVIDPDDIDRVNQRVIDEFKENSIEEVRMYEQQAYNSLMKIVETVPVDHLFNRHRFNWTQGEPFVNWIIRNTYEHFDEHVALLERREAEREGSLPMPVVVTGAQGPVILQAGDFIHRTGRDIEKALYDFHFGSDQLEDVRAVLARYQNEDGGFFGLEVDIHAPQSNPFATELALVAMRWLDVPRDHPVLLRTVEYLEDSQLDDGTWRFSPEIYEHDLAPWFKNWHWPNINPSCSIAGVLKQLDLGSNRLHDRVQALFERLATPGDLTGNAFYEVRPYAYYLQTEWDFSQAEFYRWGVVWWMLRQHLTNPELDATHLLDFAASPQSAIARRLPDAVLRAKLDELLGEQAEDGGWPTPYDPKWRGWNTIFNLLILRAHGRL